VESLYRLNKKVNVRAFRRKWINIKKIKYEMPRIQGGIPQIHERRIRAFMAVFQYHIPLACSLKF